MTGKRHAGSWLWLLTIVLVGLNLRPFLTASGPLGPLIQSATGMSAQHLSWLTLLPMVMFGIGTWLAPEALRRFGARPAMNLALGVLALGCALRLAGAQPGVLLLTAAMCGIGVALAQGMLPALIKLRSPMQVAPMMGAYSAALMAGGALGAQLSPLAVELGVHWQAALAMWALPVMVALVLASVQLGNSASGRGDFARSARTAGRWLLRRRRSWLLVASFGLMNSAYVSMVAWVAPYYQGLGWSAAESGSLIALVSIAQAVAALSWPMLAARQRDRRPWLWLGLGCQAFGFAALAWWPESAPLLSAAVLGLGLGGCFPFFMLVALDHLPQPLEAGALNALMQGGGFIISALAPSVLALLLEYNGSLVSGWQLHLLVVGLVAAMVWRFDPARYDQAMQAPHE